MPKPIKRHPTLPLSLVWHIAWENLFYKKLRSALTILGITVGIGAIYFLLSLGLGLRNLVTKEIIGSQSLKSIDVTTSNSKLVKLDQALFERVASIGNIEKAGKTFTTSGTAGFGNSGANVIVYASDDDFIKMANLALVAGKQLQKTDVDKVLINTSMLAALGITKPQDAIGKKLAINIPYEDKETGKKTQLKDEYMVAGVVDSGSGSEIYLPEYVLANVGSFRYAMFKVSVTSTASVPMIRQQIESLGLRTSSPIDTIDQVNQIFHYVYATLIGLGTIGMIIAILGMFNTLTISLLERTKEIGLLKAIGTQNSDLAKLFIAEAELLSLLGALAGILGAISLSKLVDAYINHSASSRGIIKTFTIFSHPLWLSVGIIAAMLVIGMVIVFIPARHAQQLNAIDAMRRE